MVQVLQPQSRKSFAQSVLGGLVEGGSNALQQYQQMKQTQQNKMQEMAQLYGLQHLKGQQSLELQAAKDAAKQQRMQESQDYINRLFGGQQPQAKGIFKNEGQENTQPNIANLPDEIIANVSLRDPQTGRLLQSQKAAAQEQARHEQNVKRKELESSPEFQREQLLTSEQAKADSKYNHDLQSAKSQHRVKTHTIQNLRNLNKKGVTGKPYEKALEKFGLIAFTSEGRREFASEVKNLITDIRSILGSQFSTFEFSTILNAYPSADFSKEANNAILNNLEIFSDIRNKEFEIADQLKKQNKGKLPLDYQSRVNEELNKYANSKIDEIKNNVSKVMNEEYGVSPGNVLMFAPDGEPLNVSPDQVEYYQSLGASLP